MSAAPALKITPPAQGAKIIIANGKLSVPVNPIVPFIEGDGTGPDIWRASVRVLDAVKMIFDLTGHQAQIKEFLDFAYQDKYQLAFDKEYDLLPATTTAATALSSDPVFGPFLTALPNSVQYPSDTSWANVKAKIQQTIGLAVTGTPSTELSQLQQVATTSAS